MGDGNDPYFHDLSGGKPGDFATERPRRGCLFYGCIGVLVLGAVAGVLLAVATTVLYRFSSRLVEQYTATAPEPVPVVTLPEKQVEAIEARVDAFQDATDAGQPATLSLTAEEINALIARDPDFRGRVAVEIEGDQLGGRLSFPLEQLGLPDLILGGLKGRYLNGTARFTPLLQDDGKLAVRIDELIVKGQPVPENVLAELRKSDMTIDFGPEDTDRREFVQRLESIKVKGGRLILTARPAADKGGAPDAASEPTGAADGEVIDVPPPPPAPPPPPPDAPTAGAPSDR